MNPALQRRSLLASGALLAGAMAGCATGTPAGTGKKPATFLLVHGAWHGAWCYQKVARILRSQGHQVFTITLSGLAERSHTRSPDIRLATHVQDVVDLVKWEELDDFVLVGHSYGGMVVTGAAEQLGAKIRSIVYLDAYVPEDGQALSDLAGEGVRARTEATARASGGFLNPIPARVFGIDEANQAWVDSKCTLQPAATFLDPLPVAQAYKRVPKRMYLRATRFKFPAFDRIEARLRALPGWDIRRWDASHDMMVDLPEKTADYLLEAI